MFTLGTQRHSTHKIGFRKQLGLSLGHEIKTASMVPGFGQGYGQKLDVESLIMKVALPGCNELYRKGMKYPWQRCGSRKFIVLRCSGIHLG